MTAELSLYKTQPVSFWLTVARFTFETATNVNQLSPPVYREPSRRDRKIIRQTESRKSFFENFLQRLKAHNPFCLRAIQALAPSNHLHPNQKNVRARAKK